MKSAVKKSLKHLFFTFFVILGTLFFQNIALNHNASAVGQGSAPSSGTTGSLYYGAFWTHFTWDKDGERADPLYSNRFYDIYGGSLDVWGTCGDTEGFYIIMSNDSASRFDSKKWGPARSLHDRLTTGGTSNFQSVGNRGYRTSGANAWADRIGIRDGEVQGYYEQFLANNPRFPNLWYQDSDLNFFCDGGTVVELASKSAIPSYKDGSTTKTINEITNLNGEKESGPHKVDSDQIEVTFEQYLYLKPKSIDPKNLPGSATVRYSVITSHTPNSVSVTNPSVPSGVTKPLNSFSWQPAPDESDYYRTKVTDDSNKVRITMPKEEGVVVKVCQSIEFEPKKLKISGSEVTKTGKEDSKICISFSRNVTTNTEQFLSKSGAGYDGGNMTLNDQFDVKRTIPTVTVDSDTVTVDFAQRIYIYTKNAKTKDELRTLKSRMHLEKEIETTYEVFVPSGNSYRPDSSVHGGIPTQAPTAVNTSTIGWTEGPEGEGYFYIEVQFHVAGVEIPEEGTVTLCQGIRYNPKFFTYTSSGHITYSGSGESQVCISFKRGDEVVEEDYCPDMYDANINFGSTYGWAKIDDLTKGKAKSTMEEFPDIKNTSNPNDKNLSVRIYVKPGTTIQFSHALCYGAQAVRSLNNVRKPVGTVGRSKRNLRQNTVEIRGNYRKVFYKNKIGADSGGKLTDDGTRIILGEYGTSNNSQYTFGNYNSSTSIRGTNSESHTGIVGAGEKTLAGGLNKSYRGKPALIYTTTLDKEDRDYEDSELTAYNVNGVSHWGFKVLSPYLKNGSEGANDESLACPDYYYEDSFKKGGYQISSAYNGGNCKHGKSPNDVGKGIAQQIVYLPVFNWIKELHSGVENSTFWCRCNPRKYHHNGHNGDSEAPWHAEPSTGYGDDKGKYIDMQGYDLIEQVFTTKDKYDTDVSQMGGPGNWGRERSGKVNKDGSSGDSDSDRAVARSKDTDDGKIQYNNNSTDEKDSTLSIANYSTLNYTEVRAAVSTKGAKQVGWLYFKCSESGQCKDTWTENIHLENEVTKQLPGNHELEPDPDPISPSKRVSGWQEGENSSSFSTETTSSRVYCHSGSSYILAEGGICYGDKVRKSDSDYTSTWTTYTYSCPSGTSGPSYNYDTSSYYCTDSKGGTQAATSTSHEHSETHYAYSCTVYYSSSSSYTYTIYDSASCTYSGYGPTPVYKYRYYNCDSSYPYSAPFSAWTRFVEPSKWNDDEAAANKCYQYRFRCDPTFSYDGFDYNIFPKDTVLYNEEGKNGCRIHRCEDNTKRNKNNITNDDHNDTNACSFCQWDLAGKWPLDVETLGGKVRPNVPGGENFFDPFPVDEEKGAKTGGGCQFNVNVRNNFSIAKNETRTNIRNNGPTNNVKIPVHDNEPEDNQSYWNSTSASGSVNGGERITKTAEVLIPYNYFVATDIAIDRDKNNVYLGENVKMTAHTKVYGRVNNSVDTASYATYTQAPEDDLQYNRGTVTAIIQFIVSPNEKNGLDEEGKPIAVDRAGNVIKYSGEVKEGWEGEGGKGEPESLCEAFGRTYGTNCELVGDPIEKVLNEKGDPLNREGGPKTSDTTFSEISVTTPDDPTQVEVGSLFCVAIGVYPGDSHGTGVKYEYTTDASGKKVHRVDEATGEWVFTSNTLSVNGMSHFDDAKWSVSDASCRTVTKKPNFEVWNGGTYTEGSIDTALANKATNWKLNRKPANLSDYIAYGSWDEFAVTAGGTVTNFASGAANGIGTTKNETTLSSSYALQTISNTRAGGSSPTGAGGSGITGITPDVVIQKLLSRYADDTNANATFPMSDPKQIGTGTGTNPNSNAYYYKNITNINGAIINSGTHVIHSNSTVYIKGNICVGGVCGSSTTRTLYQPSYMPDKLKDGSDNPALQVQNLILKDSNTKLYTDIEDIPQVIIIAPEIHIDVGVTQVDAWLIAASGASASGVTSYGSINTCTNETVGATLHLEDCKKTLIVNGPVIAKQLILNRTSGANQGEPRFRYCEAKPGQDYKTLGASYTVDLSCYASDTEAEKARRKIGVAKGSTFDLSGDMQYLFDIGRQINLADFGSATPAEIFNMRTDNYLWAYSQLNRYTQASTVYSREVAPRY